VKRLCGTSRALQGSTPEILNVPECVKRVAENRPVMPTKLLTLYPYAVS